MKSQLSGQDPNAGKDRRQVEKGMTEDEMIGWHHQLNGHEFKQTLGGSEGQGSLVGCSLWGCKESDMTEGLLLHFTSCPWNLCSLCLQCSLLRISVGWHSHHSNCSHNVTSSFWFIFFTILSKTFLYITSRDLKI